MLGSQSIDLSFYTGWARSGPEKHGIRGSIEMEDSVSQLDYERIGKFIYGACRYGADRTDIMNWMADDLGIARPDPDDDPVAGSLYTAYAAKYDTDDEFYENCERFFDKLKSRGI
jgi:hypothetical protein